MAIGDVGFLVERLWHDKWEVFEFYDLYEDALGYALKVQAESDGSGECRIIRYTSLSEEDHGRYKTKIVAVFKPMPGYQLRSVLYATSSEDE